MVEKSGQFGKVIAEKFNQKSGQFGKVIAEKFNHLEGNFDFWDTEIHKKYWDIWLSCWEKFTFQAVWKAWGT